MKENIFFLSVNLDTEHKKTLDYVSSVGFNYGNCLFHYAVKKKILSEDQDTNEKICILSLANQINPGFTNYSNHLSNIIDKYDKVLLLSIGQQSNLNQEKNLIVQKEHIDFLEKVSKKCNCILTRGDFTTNIIKSININNVMSVGCPSLMINEKNNLGEIINEKFLKGNFQKILFGIHDITSIYSKHIVRLCKKYKGEILLQDDINLLTLSREKKDSEKIKELYKNHYTDQFSTYDEFTIFLKNNTFFTHDIPKWIEYVKKFDCYLGLKIHGAISGIMAEIPSVCIIHDNRLLELVTQCHVPHINCDEFLTHDDINKIMKFASFDAEKFDTFRKTSAKIYSNELIYNGLNVGKDVLALAEL
jgi:hypothetical protein